MRSFSRKNSISAAIIYNIYDVVLMDVVLMDVALMDVALMDVALMPRNMANH
ncbi:hypothetical protein ACTXGK_09975 [Psychrobacter sp. T6-5]|uniref:hypothetical protein n=1 Tax=Psychrobacter sp. T6-5 TaxID=3457451 RepID=UPI003FD19173